MEKKFTSDEVPLAQLLDQAKSGVLQLPDFQRGWVWDDNHIASLLASISVSYPIGSVMTLQTGNPDVRFRPRPLEGVDLNGQIEPEYLLLDGQQRSTSLYLALKSGKPVPTRDTRGKEMLRRYYADIKLCIDPNADREDAILSVPEDGIVKTFGREEVLDVSTREKEIAAGMFPLDIVLDQSETQDWMFAYVQAPGADLAERHETWKQFTAELINPFIQYQVPTIQLVKSTPKEAVCQVFEKVNTGGVSLTVFELLTATYAADNFNLRDDWKDRAGRFAEFPVLSKFEATDFLQIVSLLATADRRRRHLEDHGDTDKAPAVSCKRKDVLRLSLEDYVRWADPATKAVERVVPFLHSEHIFKGRDLPYPTQLVPLSAMFATLEGKAESHGVRQKLRRWYWCGVFGEMYGGSTETRFANDLQDVVPWVDEDTDEPRTVKEAQFQAARLLTLRTRQSAAYKGLYALQMSRGAKDLRTGNTIDVHAYFDDAIDIHHIFPQKWCAKNGIDKGIMNSVVNKTAIDAKTNGTIGGDAPSQYLDKLESSYGIDDTEMDALLRSHDIDPVSLRENDFQAFFNRRFERLLKQIGEAMGKPVNRSALKDESPFVDPAHDVEHQRRAVQAVIEQGEGKVVEFKSTALKNLHTGERDFKMEWSVIKTLAGFMNANGGTLLVGVADDGGLVGLQEDYPLIGKSDRDGWELWLSHAVTNALGQAAAAELEVTIVDIGDKDIARIEVGPAAQPIFAVPSKGEKTPKFVVRINNESPEMAGEEAHKYQKKRWPE